LIGNPVVPSIPLAAKDSAARPKRPKPPKLPPAALMPPVPKTNRLAKIKLVKPQRPVIEEKHQTLPAGSGAAPVEAKLDKGPEYENTKAMDPEVAFKVEPTPQPVATPTPPSLPALPPLPKPAGIPLEHKAMPELLPVAERSDETRIPPRLLSSLPPPPSPEPELALQNPFEPVQADPEPVIVAGGFEPKSAGIGFAVGAALVAVIAFALWPTAPAPLASNLADSQPVAEEPIAEELVAEEPVAEEPVAEAPVAEEPVAEEAVEEPVAEEPVAEEPVAEEPVAARAPARSRPDRIARAQAEPVARNRPRPRTRPEPVVSAQPARPILRPWSDGPVIDSEPASAPVRRPAPSGNRPATPTRQDVAGAIQAIGPQLRQCAPDLHGHVANVRFTFVSSGRATSALVPNDFGSPQARSCVARVARQARVPEFSDPRLIVTYPVQF